MKKFAILAISAQLALLAGKAGAWGYTIWDYPGYDNTYLTNTDGGIHSGYSLNLSGANAGYRAVFNWNGWFDVGKGRLNDFETIMVGVDRATATDRPSFWTGNSAPGIVGTSGELKGTHGLNAVGFRLTTATDHPEGFHYNWTTNTTTHYNTNSMFEELWDVQGSLVVGAVRDGSGNRLAARWTHPNQSPTFMHPGGPYHYSQIFATDGLGHCGLAKTGTSTHACWWNASTNTFQDLTPSSFQAFANDITGKYIVGYFQGRARLWNTQAFSFVDLGAVLPAGWSSNATSVYYAGKFLFVSGYATDTNGKTHGIIWKALLNLYEPVANGSIQPHDIIPDQLTAADDDRGWIFFDVFAATAELRMQVDAAYPNPSELNLVYEGSGDRDDVLERMQIFNPVSGFYDTVSSRLSTPSDSRVEVNLPVPSPYFAENTNELNARMQYIPQADYDASDGWFVFIDEFSFVMKPAQG